MIFAIEALQVGQNLDKQALTIQFFYKDPFWCSVDLK